ncbi:hypothetical protein VIGAN_01108700 [Vigna angularis var. angularis]|uniref:Uncharacterized protein n=1 Tax=Vigna angularis var. angularis TaxID=157739 RepID=A0A0S3QZ20_PHAAN|nr:hypothetical protein VIGAN_01108700 [Vigna angularis var. angularis]
MCLLLAPFALSAAPSLATPPATSSTPSATSSSSSTPLTRPPRGIASPTSRETTTPTVSAVPLTLFSRMTACLLSSPSPTATAACSSPPPSIAGKIAVPTPNRALIHAFKTF